MEGRLLVVDDEPDVLESTTLLLRAEGYDVDATTRWEEVSSMLERASYHALLQDVHMPGLDVVDLVARVRAAHRDLVVMLFTASANGVQLAKSTRADGLIEKPFELDALVTRLERLRRIRAIV